MALVDTFERDKGLTPNGVDMLALPAKPHENKDQASALAAKPPQKKGSLQELWPRRFTASQEERPKLKKKKSMFASADDMKMKLKENLQVKQYDVSDYYWKTGACRTIATNNYFENTTLGVISFNALWISIDTDYNGAATLNDADPVFILMENLFCVYFTFEWIVRFGAFQSKMNCIRDAWFVFDTFMVFMMVMETWVMFTVVAASGANPADTGNASTLRLLRLLRLSRMARMARLLRSMPELLILIKGIGAALRTVFFVLVLLFILVYVFAIFFRQMTSDTELGNEFFQTTMQTMHALIAYGTLCDAISEISFGIAESDSQDRYVLLVVWFLFVILAALMLLQMLIGVLCEVVVAVAATEKENIEQDFMRDSFYQIIKKYPDIVPVESASATAIADPFADDDDAEPWLGQVMISREQFLRLMAKPELTDLLVEVGINAFDLVDLVDIMFVGNDGEEHSMQTAKLIQELLEHRSTNHITVKDVTDMRKFVDASMVKWKATLDSHLHREKEGSLELGVQINILGQYLEKEMNAPEGTFEREASELAEKALQKWRNTQKRMQRGSIASAGSADGCPEGIKSKYRNGSMLSILNESEIKSIGQAAGVNLETIFEPDDAAEENNHTNAAGDAECILSDGSHENGPVGAEGSPGGMKKKKKKKAASKSRSAQSASCSQRAAPVEKVVAAPLLAEREPSDDAVPAESLSPAGEIAAGEGLAPAAEVAAAQEIGQPKEPTLGEGVALAEESVAAQAVPVLDRIEVEQQLEPTEEAASAPEATENSEN